MPRLCGARHEPWCADRGRMKFIIDAQLPRALCGWLREAGHEAEHVFDVLGPRAPDGAIVRYADAHGMTIVTKDDDFAGDLRQGRAVLWLRCGNVRNPQLASWLLPRLPAVEALFQDGVRFVELER